MLCQVSARRSIKSTLVLGISSGTSAASSTLVWLDSVFNGVFSCCGILCCLVQVFLSDSFRLRFGIVNYCIQDRVQRFNIKISRYED